MEIISRVAKFGKDRLIVEIPKKDRLGFNPGDFVLVRVVDPREEQNA